MIREAFDVCNEYRPTARLVCFTGGVLKLNVRRLRHYIISDNPKYPKPYFRILPQKYPPFVLGPTNPNVIDWNSYYCVIDVGLSGGQAAPNILKHGHIGDCEYFINQSILPHSPAARTFVLLSLDGHVYHITSTQKSGTFSVDQRNGEHVQSWPFPYIIR